MSTGNQTVCIIGGAHAGVRWGLRGKLIVVGLGAEAREPIAPRLFPHLIPLAPPLVSSVLYHIFTVRRNFTLAALQPCNPFKSQGSK